MKWISTAASASIVPVCDQVLLHIRKLRRAALVMCCLTAFGVFALRTFACPLCLAPSQTWTEMIAEADVVVLAQLVSRHEGSEKVTPYSVVKVVAVHKGKKLLPEKKQLRIGEYIFAEKGDLVLLKGGLVDVAAANYTETFASEQDEQPPAIQRVSATEIADSNKPSKTKETKILAWDFYEKSRQVSFDYLIAAPSVDADAAERLKYFIPFLEHSDPLVATDAWSEFANAEYKDIKRVADLFSTQNLRKWIADPKAEPERRGLYGLMLGMCGTDSDAEFLQTQIGEAGSNEIRFGTEGLMGGLLLLAGHDGLTFLEASRLTNEKASGFDCFPVIQALQFAWTYEPDQFEKERLRAALRPLLKRPEVREIVLRDLARWEDWNAVRMLSAVYEDSKVNDVHTVRAIASFLIMCRQSVAEDDEADANVIAAAELLEVIRKDHAGIVITAEEELGQ